jgi:alkanesulfonate monooxygenase SsuD/methylene tetrahydromethanopterin reductase-like flavin-dependent oxidoreductase (luciferase family)
MKFGFHLNTQAPPAAARLPEVYQELFETVAALEDAGFDTAFLPEHHQMPDGYLSAPLVMAGAILARTERLRVQTGILVLPLWDPMRIAEDVAVLDVMAPGRFTLGVGLGLVPREFAQFGVDRATAVGRFEEQIYVLRSAWREGSFEYWGEHFKYESVNVQPKPVTKDGPELYIGGSSPRAVARAGRLGDGWFTGPLDGIEMVGHLAEVFRASATEHKTPGALWLQRDGWVSNNSRAVEEIWAPHIVENWKYYFDIRLKGRKSKFDPYVAQLRSADDITFEGLRKDRVVAGSPDEVVASLKRLAEQISPEGICLRMRLPYGPDHAAVLDSIRLFGSEVIPQFR